MSESSARLGDDDGLDGLDDNDGDDGDLWRDPRGRGGKYDSAMLPPTAPNKDAAIGREAGMNAAQRRTHCTEARPGLTASTSLVLLKREWFFRQSGSIDRVATLRNRFRYA